MSWSVVEKLIVVGIGIGGVARGEGGRKEPEPTGVPGGLEDCSRAILMACSRTSGWVDLMRVAGTPAEYFCWSSFHSVGCETRRCFLMEPRLLRGWEHVGMRHKKRWSWQR
jgi:hypothetical protein